MPVTEKFKEVIMDSFVLGSITFILQIAIAIPLGIIAAENNIVKQTML